MELKGQLTQHSQYSAFIFTSPAFDSLDPDQRQRLLWVIHNPPRPRRLEQLPPDPILRTRWLGFSYYTGVLKIFPDRPLYKRAYKLLDLQPPARFPHGTPPEISAQMNHLQAPPSVFTISETMYHWSRYDHAWGMRVCETSVKALTGETGLSKRTIIYALDFLRKHRYARRIWRGRPDPEEARYRHSCYELPCSLDHVLAWRIHGGRPGSKPQLSTSSYS